LLECSHQATRLGGSQGSRRPSAIGGFHDLRHYYASLLVSSGSDVKVVQARLRHASAKTTLDTYAHLWPDSDDSTRTAVDKVLAARIAENPQHPGDFPGTRGGGEARNA
jgi:integrase